MTKDLDAFVKSGDTEPELDVDRVIAFDNSADLIMLEREEDEWVDREGVTWALDEWEYWIDVRELIKWTGL